MGGGPNRRQFLAFSVVATTAIVGRPSSAQAHRGERAISLYNMHTGESVKTVFWADGVYVDDGMNEINRLLRDYRTEDVIPIDPRLIETLYRLRRKVGVRRPYHVFSGYRSPLTNAILRKSDSGVAKNSYHMRGMAVDMFLPKVELRTLHHAALALRAGGVGYYPKPGFVHLDSGRVRAW
jgi:uncharacterized protein YcbK (DUF882 family)